MRIHFKPFWGLTTFVIIATAILLTLGTWQYHRLAWKTNLLAEVDAAITAPPLRTVSDILDAYARGEAVDFRRFDVTATPVTSRAPFFVYTTENKSTYWRPYTPVTDDGASIFAAFGAFADGDKAQFTVSDLGSEPVRLVGYIRKSHIPRGLSAKIEPKPSVEQNRYFRFDQTKDWERAYNINIDTALYLDIQTDATEGETLPIKRPDIRNNHFDYMLTWYSFAIILLIIYIILHVREGRLYIRRERP